MPNLNQGTEGLGNPNPDVGGFTHSATASPELKEFIKECNLLKDEVHQMAKEKGWWDSPRNVNSVYALFISEIAEALEEEQKPKFEGQDRAMYFIKDGVPVPGIGTLKRGEMPPSKPEGTLVELGDLCIRILDYMGYHNYNVERINEYTIDETIRLTMGGTRAESFEELAPFRALTCFVNITNSVKEEMALSAMIQYAFEYARHTFPDVKFIDVIKTKFLFNSTRSRKHGGKKY